MDYAGTPLRWALWSYDWQPAQPGEHKLRVRVTDGMGARKARQAITRSRRALWRKHRRRQNNITFKEQPAMAGAAQRVEDEFGSIDIWINNATTSVFSPIREMTADEFKRVTEVTYLGVVYGTQAALRRMLPRDGGVIVQVGSALAYRAIPLQSAYCAAKHAIQGFTESLRCELIHDNSNVHVTMVHLPAVNTPQFGGTRASCRIIRSPCRRSTSPKSPPKRSITRRTSGGAR